MIWVLRWKKKAWCLLGGGQHQLDLSISGGMKHKVNQESRGVELFWLSVQGSQKATTQHRKSTRWRNLRCSKYPKHEQEDDDDRWYVSTWAGGSKRVRPHEASFALDVAFTQQANYNSNTLASAVQFLHQTIASTSCNKLIYKSFI